MIRPGLYQHYKGDLYWVEGIGPDSTNGAGGEWYVFYRSLQNEICHVRKLAEFDETVQTPDGPTRRFRYVNHGEQITRSHGGGVKEEWRDGE